MDSTPAPLRVLALSHTDVTESCTAVRLAMPLNELAASGHIDYALLHLMPWNVGTIRHTLRTLHKWDIVWILRPRHYFMLPIIRAARNLGKPVIIDIDDWLLDVPAGHVDAGFYRTRPRRETIRMALRAADVITVSTPIIAERCLELGAYVEVLPNAIDCRHFMRLPRQDDVLTIAFCGSPSHYEDISLISPALRRILEDKDGRVRVVTVGCPIPELQGIPGYTHLDFVVAAEYPPLLSQLRIDIGLAPLLDTPFNRAKSDIKYLEYSATGAATIASPVAPYQASVNVDRGVFVYPNTPEAWATAILQLIGDDSLRHCAADSAYNWVRRERSIEATASKWHTLFRACAEGRVKHVAPGRRQMESSRFERMMANILIRQTPYDTQQLRLRLLQSANVGVRKRLQRPLRQ